MTPGDHIESDGRTPDQRAAAPAGVVVAGGFSHRFGEADKALARVDGETLLRWVARPVAAVVGELVVNCRHEQVDGFRDALSDPPMTTPLTFAIDSIPDVGPVAGFRHGLQATTSSHALVVGCDFPFLTTSVLETLHDRLRTTDAEAVVATCADGRVQPLCGAYAVDPTRIACEATTDDARLRTVLDRLETRTLTLPNAEEVTTDGDGRSTDLALFNVNTRKDLGQAARLVERTEAHRHDREIEDRTAGFRPPNIGSATDR